MMKLVSDLPVVHVPIGKLASERARLDEKRRRARAWMVVSALACATLFLAGWRLR